VPRYTNQLVASGRFTVEDCYRIHGETIERVYGVAIHLP